MWLFPMSEWEKVESFLVYTCYSSNSNIKYAIDFERLISEGLGFKTSFFRVFEKSKKY